MKTKKDTPFTPMRLYPKEWKKSDAPVSKLTCTCTLKGPVVDDFLKLCDDYGLSRSQLLTQMAYHCLGRTAELEDFYKRLALLDTK